MTEQFHYSFNDLEKGSNSGPNQNILEALGKDALRTTNAEALLDKSESEAIEDLKKDIESQAQFSFFAAAVMIDHLNTLRYNHASFGEQLIIPAAEEELDLLYSKMDEWETNGSLKYCNDYIEKNGGSMTLVATPNTLVSSAEFFSLAKHFGEGQPLATCGNRGLYELYTPEELSGPLFHPNQMLNSQAGQPPLIRFNLIPTALEPNFQGNVVNQRTQLQELRDTNPNIKIPSPLDAVANWYNLRARGDKLKDSDTYHKTLIRHFDLDTKIFDNMLCVPYSYVSGDFGGPDLFYSEVARDTGGRIALG